MISHQAYFEFLAGSDRDAAAWQPVLAGLVVLRLIDSRVGDESASVIDWASVESVRSTVAALNEGDPVRSILFTLIDAVAGSSIRREVIGRGLLAYGRALNFEGRWALACDVFAAADRIAGAPDDARISIESSIALGAASRRMGDWDASAHAYARAAHVANSVGDEAGALQVEVGRANTHIARGNLPAAESTLDNVIEQARAAHSNEVLGLALHGRATAAHQKGEYTDAVRLGYEALEATTNPTARDAILSDIAAAFAGLGLRDSARDSYLIVAATSQSQWVRWQATLNLMELAGLDGSEADFDAYARELEHAPLDPRLRAYYFVFLSAGQQQFGREAEAEASLAKGLAIAETNQFHQIVHETLIALGTLKSHEASRPRFIAPPAEVPLSLRQIASELCDLREAAISSP